VFIGQYRCSVKDNNRVEIPPAFRDSFASQLVITQGFDRNILVLPLETFGNLSRLVSALNIADPLARGLQRMLLGNAAYATIDQAGGISLPGALKEFAQMASDAVMVGQGNFIELWAQPLWYQQELNLQDAEANAMRFSSVNLAGL